MPGEGERGRVLKCESTSEAMIKSLPDFLHTTGASKRDIGSGTLITKG